MKLYCGNLNYALTDRELEDLFAEHGSVASAVIVTDRDSGRSKGFGFVTMPDDAEAAGALDMINGSTFRGRRIVVSEARAKESAPPPRQRQARR